MLNTIIIIAAILILVILFAIFRVSSLVDVIKGDSSTKIPSSNGLQANLLLLFLIAGLIGGFYYSFGGLEDDFVLPVASKHGVITDTLFWWTMAITGVVFIVTHIFLFGFSWKYQHRENQVAYFYPHNNKLEMIWTIIPAIVLAALVFTGWKAWMDITRESPEGSEVIEIMGYQYAWSVRYPGADNVLGDYDYLKIDATNQMGIDFSDRASFDDFIPREIHVPKGKPVRFNIRARDVIHSVYQPHFRLQMNAVPGMPTQFWFEPIKTTEEMRIETKNPDFQYELVCNKICGQGHFAMRYIIVVDELEDYKEWFKSQEPWLKQNADYLTEVPAKLREAASIVAGIQNPSDLDAPNGLTISGSK